MAQSQSRPFLSPNDAAVPSHSSVPHETVESSSDASKNDRRLVLRQREQRARERRVLKTSAMHEQVETLSRLAFALSLVDDADVIWDDFLDDDVKRTRSLLRRLSPVVREVQQLRRERSLLVQLVKEHELVTRAIQELANAERQPVDPWQANVQRWRALARIHFRPWTLQQCHHELEIAANEMNRFELSNDKESTGLTLFGWEYSRCMDPHASRFQFALHKNVCAFDMDSYVAMSWRVYTELKLYSDIIYAGTAKLSLDILQEVTPTMVLVRYVESDDNRPTHIHRIYLIARVNAEKGGVVQYMRSVSIPEIQRAINQEHDVWAVDFHWLRWDLLEPGAGRPHLSTDFRVLLGGTMGLQDLAYLQYWLFALVRAIVRYEAASINRQLLEF